MYSSQGSKQEIYISILKKYIYYFFHRNHDTDLDDKLTQYFCILSL